MGETAATVDRSPGRSSRVVALVGALVAALALAGCGGGGEAPPVAAIVERSLEATGAVKSFHFVLDIQNVPPSETGLALQSAEGDVVVPDRLAADVAGTLEGVPITTRLIVIGRVAYIENPLTRAWQQMDVSTSPVAFFDPAEGVLAVIEGARDLVNAGTDSVDGTEAYRLEGRVPTSELTPLLGNPPAERLVRLTMWIGVDDFLLRRIRVDGPLSGEEPEGASRVVEVSRPDEQVSISPPEELG